MSTVLGGVDCRLRTDVHLAPTTMCLQTFPDQRSATTSMLTWQLPWSTSGSLPAGLGNGKARETGKRSRKRIAADSVDRMHCDRATPRVFSKTRLSAADALYGRTVGTPTQ